MGLAHPLLGMVIYLGEDAQGHHSPSVPGHLAGRSYHNATFAPEISGVAQDCLGGCTGRDDSQWLGCPTQVSPCRCLAGRTGAELAPSLQGLPAADAELLQAGSSHSRAPSPMWP